MKFRVPIDWLYEYSARLLREADISDEVIGADLQALIYEAGERNYDEEGGFYYIYFDFDD